MAPAKTKKRPVPKSAPAKRPAKLITTAVAASARELPIYARSDWDTVQAARSALNELEQQGLFRRPALLEEAMGRDDRISATLRTRLNGLLGLPLEFEAAEDSDAARKLADQVGVVWPKLAPKAELRKLLRSGLMLGLGVGRNIYDTSSGEWRPRLRTYHPGNVQWRWDTWSYWITLPEGQVELPEESDGDWVIYTPYGLYRGWMEAMVRPLVHPWLVRTWARRDWARYSEVHGQPTKVGIVPAGAKKDAKDRFLALLRRLGGEPVVQLEKDDKGNGFDFKLVEAMATGWESFDRILEHCDSCIAVTVLGQNLTTEVKEGSRAAAQVQDRVRQEYQQADAEGLQEALKPALVDPYVDLNGLGPVELAPSLRFQTEPPEDTAKTADALQKLGGFLTAAKTSGAPVNVRELLEQQGVPTLTEAEEAEQKAEAAERAAQAAAAMQQAQPGQQPGQGGAPPGAEDDDGDEDEPAKLSDRPAALTGQAYVDQVAAQAMRRGAQALQVDLQTVLQQVQAASSPDDLRARLLRAYPHLQADAFARVLDRAQVMAELAGRSAVLEEL